MNTPTCNWHETAEGRYETDCHEEHDFPHGCPEGNYFRFCPYCGRSILSHVFLTEQDIREEKADRWLQERKDMS